MQIVIVFNRVALALHALLQYMDLVFDEQFGAQLGLDADAGGAEWALEVFLAHQP